MKGIPEGARAVFGKYDLLGRRTRRKIFYECWLGNQDSNLDLWIQNPLSYH